jgi:hypothetical protein
MYPPLLLLGVLLRLLSDKKREGATTSLPQLHFFTRIPLNYYECG